MTRLGSVALIVVAFGMGVLLWGGRQAPITLAQPAPDRSEVVVVLDFSASILEDAANRNLFAAALERIADRVDTTSSDLVAGDSTVSIVQFATSAADYPGCVDLKLIESPETVTRFAECLRNVAKAYRKGLDPALTKKIGVDTNYVAAMERASQHLAVDAVRPALILFTDGKHDVPGVPVSAVVPARDRLFGSRSPFALLPVGMGLDPTERGALERGLLNLRIIRAMPACVSGTEFAWPQVVFGSPDEAGNAVAVALQDATCTFTVAPTPTASVPPTPTPVPTPGAVSAVTLSPGDGRITVSWTPPGTTSAPIVGYRARCRSGSGEWITAGEGAPAETSAIVEGLTNGLAYECAVAAVGAGADGPWVGGLTTAMPVGLPGAPGKPTVEALDHAVRVQVPAQGAPFVSDYRYECSADQGRTWSVQTEVPASGAVTAVIANLSNGVEYVCRAFAANGSGLSGPSTLSDAVRPCGSLLECNPVFSPVLAILGFLSLGGAFVALFLLYRGRTPGYVVAVVDVVHTANLGSGSRLGIGFVRTRPGGPITGIVPDRSRSADLRVRWRRGNRFEVTDRGGRHAAGSGEPIVITDSLGTKHEVVLRGFRTATASRVATGP